MPHTNTRAFNQAVGQIESAFVDLPGDTIGQIEDRRDGGMADTHGLGPCAARRAGSTPVPGTILDHDAFCR